MKKSEKSQAGIWFLLIVIAIYLITALFKPTAIFPSIMFSLAILKRIIFIFILVFIIMVIMNYLITPDIVSKYLGSSSGLKRWLIAVLGGIISTGPIYMWYPMLKQLKEKGISHGFIATFLYNRAVKPALIPMIILYFGLAYTIILTIIMIIMSVIQGMIFEKLEGGGYL